MKVIHPQPMLYLSTIPYRATRRSIILIQISSERRDGIWYSVALDEKGKLVACAFSDRNRREAERALGLWLPKRVTVSSRSPNAAAKKGIRLLTEFYRGKGKRTDFRLLDLSSVSKFRRDVYVLLGRIPPGKVTTYGAIARRIGGKRYARAVGTAVATNPLPLIIPCHRVVPSSLRVGNYGMCGRDPSKGGYMKQMLLKREGVRFQGERVSRLSTWNPS